MFWVGVCLRPWMRRQHSHHTSVITCCVSNGYSLCLVTSFYDDIILLNSTTRKGTHIICYRHLVTPVLFALEAAFWSYIFEDLRLLWECSLEELKPEKLSKWNKTKRNRNETSEEPFSIIFILISLPPRIMKSPINLLTSRFNDNILKQSKLPFYRYNPK